MAKRFLRDLPYDEWDFDSDPDEGSTSGPEDAISVLYEVYESLDRGEEPRLVLDYVVRYLEEVGRL